MRENRIIKFRAWDKRNKEMVRVTDLRWQEGLEEINTETYVHFPYEKDTVELMQYTGLKDKNGKEIYEGDIIREQYYTKKKDTGETRSVEMIDEVKWGKYQDEEYDWTTMCWLLGTSPLPAEIPTYYNPYWDCLDFKWEVIGNIYSNPELLEGK